MHKISIPGADLATSPEWWQRLVQHVESLNGEHGRPSNYVEKNFNAKCVFGVDGDISHFEFATSEDAAIFILAWGK